MQAVSTAAMPVAVFVLGGSAGTDVGAHSKQHTAPGAISITHLVMCLWGLVWEGDA